MSKWPHLCRVLLLLALAPAAAARAETSPGMTELLEDLNDIRREHGIPALALTLVSPVDALWVGGIGYADLASHRPSGPDTLYRIAAVSRTVAALATLIAVERGRLSLDDPLKMLVPDTTLENSWAETHPVRIAHLLEHTAGLLDSPDGGARSDSSAAAPEAAEPGTLASQWPPGLYPSYSQAGVGFAIEALQRVIDVPYEQFVGRELFAPLGMPGAGFSVDPASKA